MCMDVEVRSSGGRASDVDGQRGYGHPDVHAPRQGCQRRALRQPAGALIAADVEVGAVRISATGWEGWVLQGLQVGPSSHSYLFPDLSVLLGKELKSAADDQSPSQSCSQSPSQSCSA